MSKTFIPLPEAAYIKALLDHADPENKKGGLQRLCWHYRASRILQYPHPIRQLLNGLLHSDSTKVRRWALNTITHIGRRSENLEAVIYAIEKGREDPEILVSATPSLFSLTTEADALGILASRGIELDTAMALASAQRSDVQRASLAKNIIEIDRATPLELRMATLLVGMGKAPQHLFHRRLENRNIIGALNGHDDSLVSQYSIWAIAENPNMGLTDLRISLKDVEKQPANVRGWVYRLVVANDNLASQHVEHIILGSVDQSDEVRDGLATSLRSIYFDKLEEITLEWLTDEPSPRIRQRMFEHMAANAERCQSYLLPVTHTYRDSDNSTRFLLEGAAQGTSTYALLRRIAITNEQAVLKLEEPRGVQIVVNQKIDTGGGSIGVVSGEGTVIADSIMAVNQMPAAHDAKAILQEVLRFVEAHVNGAERSHASELIREAAKAPSKSALSKIVGWLRTAKDGVVASAQGVEAASELADRVKDIADAMS